MPLLQLKLKERFSENKDWQDLVLHYIYKHRNSFVPIPICYAFLKLFITKKKTNQPKNQPTNPLKAQKITSQWEN